MELSPSVYEHAAALIGRSPGEVSRDEMLWYEAHLEAYRRYRQTPIMPGIDIYNLEPEAYGGVVVDPGGCGIPAIVRPPYQQAADLRTLRPLDPQRDGRIPMALRVARRLADTFPEAQIRVPVSGPFSIASNLLGFESLLTEVATDPEGVREALGHLVEGQVAFAREIRRLGLGVAFFESATCPPLLSPALFQRVELPVLQTLLARMAELLGQPVPCIIGGNTAPILEAMLETGTRYVVAPFETDQALFLRKIWERTEIRVRVNLDAQAVARGPWERLQAEADRVLGLVRGRANVCLGTGALPYETPPEHVLRLREYVSRIEA